MRQHPYAGIAVLGDFNTLNDKALRDYPLKQIVRRPTRGKSTLDKIYTNVSDWYETPIIAPNIASSDHCTIVWLRLIISMLPHIPDLFFRAAIARMEKTYWHMHH